MADERDPKLSQRYRDLGREEPPRELDQTILAAAHRAAEKPHAPLVTPAGRHRWYFAFGAAAILVLAVAVTVHVERQRPDEETMTAAPAKAARPEGAPAAARETKAKEKARQEPPEAERRVAAPRRESTGASADASQRPMARASVQASLAEPPERWLERIVELRKEGKHEEAEKQLAEFRRRYPDYKVPEAALKRR